jgi:hypothetical protein
MAGFTQTLDVGPVQEEPAIAAMRTDVINLTVQPGQRTRTARAGTERLLP